MGLSLSRLLPRANPSDLFVPFQRSLGRQTRIAAACPLATIEINACVASVPAAKAAAGHTLELSLRWLLPLVMRSELFVPFQRSLGRQTRIAAACPLVTIEINACVASVPAAKAAAGHTLELSLR